ncbi:MAG: DMT family transporter [Nitrospirota bacterium]
MISGHHLTGQGKQGAVAALLAAGLFGISAPLAKLLLNSVFPMQLAGLLYLGSGMGLFILSAFRSFSGDTFSAFDESTLRGSDFPYLAGAIFCGGIAAPVLLMYGLSSITGSAASLLLNLEGILTILVASLIFKEAVGMRIWLAAIIMLVAGIFLTYVSDAEGWTFQPGSILVVLACLMWGIDNNLTRHLSHRDPFSIARYKGFVAGGTNLLISLIIGNPLPSVAALTGTLLLGVFSRTVMSMNTNCSFTPTPMSLTCTTTTHTDAINRNIPQPAGRPSALQTPRRPSAGVR